MCFSSVWHVIPPLLFGANMSTQALFPDEIEETEQVIARWWRLVAFSVKATNLLHWAMCAVCTPASGWPSKWPAKWVHFALMFCWLSPWWLQGQYGASSCLMAASSGFWWSPGHAESGNALRIAPMRPRGHHKWPATEVHLFAVITFFDCCNRSLRPCYSPLK